MGTVYGVQINWAYIWFNSVPVGNQIWLVCFDSELRQSGQSSWITAWPIDERRRELARGIFILGRHKENQCTKQRHLHPRQRRIWWRKQVSSNPSCLVSWIPIWNQSYNTTERRWSTCVGATLDGASFERRPGDLSSTQHHCPFQSQIISCKTSVWTESSDECQAPTFGSDRSAQQVEGQTSTQVQQWHRSSRSPGTAVNQGPCVCVASNVLNVSIK